MTAAERIYHLMLHWAYRNARMLGYTAAEATVEAFLVARPYKPNRMTPDG